MSAGPVAQDAAVCLPSAPCFKLWLLLPFLLVLPSILQSLYYCFIMKKIYSVNKSHNISYLLLTFVLENILRILKQIYYVSRYSCILPYNILVYFFSSSILINETLFVVEIDQFGLYSFLIICVTKSIVIKTALKLDYSVCNLIHV